MNNDLISREALKEKAETITLWNGEVRRFISYETIDNAPTIEITDYDTGYQDGLEDGLNDILPQGETNADLFKQIFGLYASEVWAMSESQFLEWRNSEYDCKGTEETDYERAVEYTQYCERYEKSYNPEDGSM